MTMSIEWVFIRGSGFYSAFWKTCLRKKEKVAVEDPGSIGLHAKIDQEVIKQPFYGTRQIRNYLCRLGYHLLNILIFCLDNKAQFNFLCINTKRWE